LKSIVAPFAVEQLKSWLPVDAVIHDGRPGIKWMNMAQVVLAEPFFSQTVARVNEERTRDQSVITNLDELVRLEKVSDSLQPSGFIFHSSRCGSTLVANACRSVKGSLVISEAPVLDKLISRFFTDLDETGTKELLYSVFLRGAVSALGQRRLGSERHYFIKFSATSILQFPRIRRIWPRVPVLFLYRHPIEVIASNLQSIPEWMHVGSNPTASAAVLGVRQDQLSSIGPEEFCARALGRFYLAAAAALDENTFLCNYQDLSRDTLPRLVKLLGVSISDEDAETIRRTGLVYSKDPSRSFDRDVDSKRAAASELTRQMSAAWAEKPYRRLVELEEQQTKQAV
jgi:hypothetical protein